MKVIVNDTTDLQVIDADGNILYEWNPFKVSNANKSVIDYISESFVSGDNKK